MRRPVMITLVAVIVLLLGATAVLFQQNRKTSSDYADMKTAEAAARAHYADAFNAIAEIQDSLNAITVADGGMMLRPQNLQAEQKLSEPNRREALESIALLNASIQRTKEKISQLEHNLKKSGTKIAGLQRMIKQLKDSVTEKQGQIDQLATRVDSLQTQVAGLETTVQQDQDTIVSKNQDIEDKRRELGTIYYIVGSKKDLANSGIIVAKGGVLGLGKTLTVTGNFNESLFTPLDTDQETVVRASVGAAAATASATPVTSSGAPATTAVPAKPQIKAEVLSQQPPSSYELKVAGNEIELHILDPKEFRKVKHLVIVTT